MEVFVKKFLIAAAAALALATVATTASAQHSRASHDGGGWSGGGSSSRSGGDWHGGGHWGGGGWHGSRIGFSFGFPGYYYWGPGYYPYAYAYPYPYGYYDGYSSYDDGAPQTYIQRDTGDAIAPAAPPAQRSQYSYYCTNPAGYYPQIANCPTGWLTVVPNGAPRAAPAPR
jgi:opacity protein-like surface antigen